MTSAMINAVLAVTLAATSLVDVAVHLGDQVLHRPAAALRGDPVEA